MRCRSCALVALACLLAGQALAIRDVALHSTEAMMMVEPALNYIELANYNRRSLLDFADTAGEYEGSQYTGDGGANYVGTVSTISCDCGFINAIDYTTVLGDIDSKSYITEVGIKCGDTVNGRTLPSGAGTYFTRNSDTGATLDATHEFSNAAGYQSISATPDTWGIVDLNDTAGAVLNCASGAVLVGLSIERNDTNGVVMRISGTCATAAEVACTNITQVDCYISTTGKYYDNSTRACEDCPLGQYAVGADQYTADCVPCAPGSYRNDPASDGSGSTPDQRIACASCQYYHASGDEATQVYYAPGYSSQVCEKVPLGSWLGSPANYSDPIPCGAGLVGKPDGSGCVPCPNGYYRTGDASPTNNACTRIPAGYYASAFAAGQPTDSGANEITACPRGSFSNWAGADLTWTAVNGGSQTTPAGTRVPASASVCKVCDADTYATLTASTACATCPAGTEPVVVDDATHIVKADGTAASIGTAGDADVPNKACSACVAGFYRRDKSDGGTSNVCVQCDAGSATKVPSGATECDVCAAGTYATAGSTDCTPCDQGKYSAAGSSSCTTCGAGYENTESSVGGSDECTKCALGTYRINATDGNGCLDAAAGSYVDVEGWSSTPKTCPAGTYSKGGAARCTQCNAGFTSSSGASSCQACNAGTFSANKATSACKACPAGTYSGRAAARCTPCKAGTFNGKSGSGLCTAAPRGSYAAGTGNKAAKKCPPGSYSNAAGRTACRKCASGQYQPLSGQTTCKVCCAAGTSVAAGTCNSWTGGKAGATKCIAVA